MKVVLINSSPRKEGNTYHCLNMVMEELQAAGIECEYIWIGMEKLHGCISCYKCFANKDNKCAVTDDKMNEYIEKLFGADGIILGTPTYVANMTANMKALTERAVLVSGANGNLLRHKVGAAVVALETVVILHRPGMVDEARLGLLDLRVGGFLRSLRLEQGAQLIGQRARQRNLGGV